MKVNRTLALILALGAAAAPLATALAKETVSVTISGPGLAGEVRVEEESFRTLSDTGGVMLGASQIPALSKDFYVVRIGIGDDTGQVFATLVYHYYADPAGTRGYLHYFDVENGDASALGSWFRAPAAWDGAFRAVLESHGVTLAAPAASNPVLQSESPPVQVLEPLPVASPEVNPWTGLALAAVITGLITGLGLRRTRVALRTEELGH